MGNEDVSPICKIKNNCCQPDSVDSAGIGGKLQTATTSQPSHSHQLACTSTTGETQKNDVKRDHVDLVDVLPIEVIEEIFQYLSPKELAGCSAVSSRWREAANSNNLWGKHCDRNGWKEDLDPRLSHFYRAHKQFRLCSHSYNSFPPICQKRLLYQKHSTLQRNWRSGKYMVHKLTSKNNGSMQLFEPVTCDGKYLVIAESSKVGGPDELVVWNVEGPPYSLCTLTLPSPTKPLEAVAFDHGTIVIAQDWFVVIYKLVGVKFETAFELKHLKELQPVNDLQTRVKQVTPFLKVTQEYIICVPSLSHSTVDFLPIFFWDRESGDLISKLTFESMYVHITSALWLNESCFLALSDKITKENKIVEFGTKTCSWEYFSQTVNSTIEQITGNHQYMLAATKATNNSTNDLYFASRTNKSKDLWLWDRTTGSLLKKFNVDGKCFQFVGKYLMFFNSALMTVVNPNNPDFKNEFEVSGTISSIKACKNPNMLVVVKTGCYIEVWDWGLGSRLYTVTAETGYGSQVWCDDKIIITYQQPSSGHLSCGVMVLGFW